MSEVHLPPTLRTPEDAARYLGVTESTLTNWRKRRTDGPPFIRLTGTTIRYRQSDLDEWLISRTKGSLVADGGSR